MRRSVEARGRRPRLLVAITDPLSTVLLRGQLAHARAAGFDVTLISGPGARARQLAAEEGVGLVEVPMVRELSPLRDLVSLWRVFRVVRRLRPDLVNAGTAKAGLLVTAAAWLNGVPGRIYTMRGIRLETHRGFFRHLLWGVERLIGAMVHRVVCVSPSLRARALQLGVVAPEKTLVLAGGSSNGVQVERFGAGANGPAAARLRGELGLQGAGPVVGFVGRLVRDKGVRELAEAWSMLREEFPDARLLLVGPEESGDPVPSAVLQALREDARVTLTGGVFDTAPYYLLMDMLVLPSYREGFPNVVLEAGASGLPVVTTTVPGCVDAVEDGITGLHVPAGDARALSAALRRYLADPGLRRRHGDAGRARVNAEFRRERIWEGLIDLYREMVVANTAAAGPAARASPGELP
ncbi:MAG: glycosyltransferase family 4 protein [Gemmatimonadetes bacterium]|nr:glycosyltransferase family 4 protein [Gemmatimonadota bacterium]